MPGSVRAKPNDRATRPRSTIGVGSLDVMLNKAVSAIASQLASKAAWFSSLLLIPGAPWRRQCLYHRERSI
jgi:hypothetical protein